MMRMNVPACLVALCWLATLTHGQPSQSAPLYRQPQPERPRASERPSPYFYPPAPVHYVNIGEKLDGDYKFGYDTGSGPAGQSYREEFRLPDGSVKGSYGYIDSRGHMRKVHYTAGKSGFIILKDERIVDKKSSTSAPKAPLVEYHVTTPPRPEYTTEEPEPVVQQTVAPVQQESRQLERQYVAAPVVLQKSAQELQAEYNRNLLAASSTVPRQQYASPEAAEQGEPLDQPPKPAPRPRQQRRRKRPKTITSTTEAPPRDIEVQRPTQDQRVFQVQPLPQAQPIPPPELPPQVVQRVAHIQGPPPLVQRVAHPERPPPVQRPPQVHRQSLPQRLAQAQKTAPVEQLPNSEPETYVPPASLVDSTHGLPRGPIGFGARISGRLAKPVFDESDQNSAPEAQPERKPSRQRTRQPARRTRRPTVPLESEFNQPIPVTRSSGRSATTQRRRRVKVVKIPQYEQVEETTTLPSPTTTPVPLTTTPPPPPVETATVAATPQFVTPSFPSAEQSFFKTHGLQYNPFNPYTQSLPVPQQASPFAPPSPFVPQTLPPQDVQPKSFFSHKEEDGRHPTTFQPPRPFPQQPELSEQAPPRQPEFQVPPRTIYQLPGFSPSQPPTTPQIVFPTGRPPFATEKNSDAVQNVPVPGQVNRTLPVPFDALGRGNITVQTTRPPFQQFFNYQGRFPPQPPPPPSSPFGTVPRAAHVFGPPVTPFQSFPGQFSDDRFRPPTPLPPPPPFSRHSFLQSQQSQTTPIQDTPSSSGTTPLQPQLSSLRTQPFEVTTPTTPVEPPFRDYTVTTPQQTTPAPPLFSQYTNARTSPVPQPTPAPTTLAQFSDARTIPVQHFTPSPPVQQQFRNFGTSPGQPQPTVASQPQYSNQGVSVAQPQSGVSVQPQYTTFGAQGAQRPSTVPDFGNLGNVQQSYDPYQQFNGGFQLPNTLFSPVQQSSQQLDNPYQYTVSNPFQAQFGGPYQPQYSNLQSFPQYQTTAGRGLGSLQDSSARSYRATNPPVIDRTLLSYDIGVPVGSRS
ncbi:unnamed protein product [Ixodes persulcatus]